MNIKRRISGLRATLDSSREIRRLGATIDSSEWDSAILVAGMRRSGNHATIGWLANAYESAPTPLDYEWGGFGVSGTGVTVHLNDIRLHYRNQPIRLTEIRRQREKLSSLGGARRLILSVEDVTRREVDSSPLFDGRVDIRVHVHRSVLNLLASRLALIGTFDAKWGPQWRRWSPPIIPMDQGFLDRISEDMTAAPDGWVVIDFDRWSTGEPAYRAALLERFGLSADIAPPVTGHGGGSSFTGTSVRPESGDLLSRWKDVEWPDELLDLLALDRNRAILTETESEQLQQLRRGR